MAYMDRKSVVYSVLFSAIPSDVTIVRTWNWLALRCWYCSEYTDRVNLLLFTVSFPYFLCVENLSSLFWIFYEPLRTRWNVVQLKRNNGKHPFSLIIFLWCCFRFSFQYISFSDKTMIFYRERRNCLTSFGSSYNPNALNSYLSKLPGQLYSADEQCIKYHGTGSSLCRVSQVPRDRIIIVQSMSSTTGLDCNSVG